jgi:Tol biopolymer transport system component
MSDELKRALTNAYERITVPGQTQLREVMRRGRTRRRIRSLIIGTSTLVLVLGVATVSSVAVDSFVGADDAPSSKSSSSLWSQNDGPSLLVSRAPSGDAEYAIYRVAPDGSNDERLFSPPGGAFSHAVSPGGTRIAFGSSVSENDVEMFVANFDGTDLTRVTVSAGYDSDPTWSPDGSQIAFISSRDGNFELYVMDPDGSNVVQLTDSETSDFHNPAWSPDGNWIAVSGLTSQDNHDVFVIHPDGSSLRKLTESQDEEGAPSWSPDGQSIVYTRGDPDLYADLYRMDSHGNHETALTSTDEYDERSPVWSPDGTQIAFVRQIVTPGVAGTWSVQVMNVGSANTTTVVPEFVAFATVEWLP